jgi:hypothetical protein
MTTSTDPQATGKSDAALRRFERLVEIPMAVLSVIFLAVLVLPVLDTHLSHRWRAPSLRPTFGCGARVSALGLVTTTTLGLVATTAACGFRYGPARPDARNARNARIYETASRTARASGPRVLLIRPEFAVKITALAMALERTG